MDDELIIMVDCENICRLCLHSTGAMSDIYATYGEKSLQQQILCITGLATEEDDGLPSKICHRCRHVVEQACELRDVVDKTSKILARTAPESNEKSLENDDIVKPHNDDDADTVIIESYVDDTRDNLEDGTVVEEYDGFQETIDMTQDTETAEINNATEMPAPVPRRSYNGGKRIPPELICQICLDQFATKEDVRTHVNAHYAGSDLEIYLDIMKRPFNCTHCDEVQLNKPQLVKHHRLHLGVNPYVCKHPGCSYVGKDRDGIRHHRVVHEPPSRVCDQCGAIFRRRSDLVSHMVRTHPTAEQAVTLSHVCTSCGLKARNEPALRRHMKAHHFAPRFPCPYGSCERAYRSRRALEDHERAHRGERRYRCPLCNAADYTSTSNLKRHMKMHDRSRMSKCDKCPATFEDYSAFYRHRVAHHGPWQPHRCRACNQGYQSESNLDKHNQTCERLKRLLAYEQKQTNGTTENDMEKDEEATQVRPYNVTVSQEEVCIEIEQENSSDDEE